jgi:hypothetical protein
MNYNFFKSKKASLVEPIFAGAFILKTSVVILIALFVWISFQTLMEAQIVGTSSETVLTGVLSSLRSAYFSMDYVFPFLVGGLLIVSTIFAYKTGTNIIWGIFSIIIWAVALLLSSVFVNVYLSVSEEFPAIYAEMPVMDIIMSNLHWLTLFWLVILSAVMFRKSNVEDDASGGQARFYGQ